MGKLKKELDTDTRSLVGLVFSWSIRDVLDQNFYRNQVQKIPDTFMTLTSYKNSFIPSLVEETHADLRSNMLTLSHAPTCEILKIEDSDGPPNNDLCYDITYERDTETDQNHKGLIYEPQVGDIIALTNVKPKCIDDLNRPPRFYHIAYVSKANDIDEFPDDLQFKILSSKPINYGEPDTRTSKREPLFAVYLMNLTTNVRVWKALKSKEGNTNIINKVLKPKSDDGDSCSVCSLNGTCCTGVSAIWPTICSENLNESQEAAVLNCISLSQCHHQNSVKLIWGPPGTGKTKTMSLSLFALFQLKCRTLTCAPTNIAVLEVAARLRRLVNQSLEYGTYGLGDIVLFGNKKRMKIDDNKILRDIFLDYRVKTLIKCLVPLSGWKHLLESMIRLLDNPEEQYSLYLEKNSEDKDYPSTFEEFVKNQFDSICEPLKICMVGIYTHIPTSCISLKVVKDMVGALELLKSIKSSLHTIGVPNEGLKLVFKDFKVPGSTVGGLTQLRTKCANTLKSLPMEFSVPINEYALRNFCLEKACLIFCTASSSAKLHVVEATRPLELLVIDEAAQLKECESAIPIQLSGLRHAILVGDERQLPAMVKSKISEEADFGRSLFERLAKLGHKKHLLNVQYRMHPSISLFPKMEFYDNQIVDGPNVKERSYERCFLKGKMYQSYSFINVANGKDELDHRFSRKNMVEVAVVSEIVANLYKEFMGTKKNVNIGVISPYKAQVYAIQEMLKNIPKLVILASPANVALTRARYCLWILGNASTLINSDSIWKKLVLDAKKRNCFYNADEDSNLAQAIATALLELGQLHSLLNIDSVLFKNAIWKVYFTDEFLNSIAKIKDTMLLREVLVLLTKLLSGWRQHHKDKGIVVHDGTSAQLLEKHKIKGNRNLIWTVDILQENADYVQVMMFWDILPFSHIPELAKRLDFVFGNFTVDKLNRCKHKCIDRNIVVPMRWPVVFSSFPEADHTEFLSKLLFNKTANQETSTSTYGETVKAANSIRQCPLISPKLRSKRKVNKKEILLWKLTAGDAGKDSSTCVAANPAEFLSKPLSSLRLTDKPAASTSTDVETVKAIKSIRHCPLTSLKIGSKRNVNQKRSLRKLKAGDGVKDFSTCLAADPMELLSKPLSSPSLTDKPAASTSTNMKTVKKAAPIRSCLSTTPKGGSKRNANRRKRSSSKIKVGDHVFLRIRPCCGIKRYSKGAKLSPRFIGPFEVSEVIDKHSCRVALPPKLSGVHDVFHMSVLKKNHEDPSQVLDWEDLRIHKDLSYEEKPVRIVDKIEQILQGRIIRFVKVIWQYHGIEEATWELEDQVMAKYPDLLCVG
ncbi:hypothetical protein M0R45_006152 [Rubus argutus]|uniref:P-loop containing nucleoside triphosphate hydrolases superfamily protein n=1 Tax=Rubus argutus TaxID=59490 RepID=A0AAW1YPM6_RUBAR